MEFSRHEYWSGLPPLSPGDLPDLGSEEVRDVQSLGGKIPCRKEWQPTPVFLPGKSHGQRTLVGYGPYGSKESDTTAAT